jgi:LPXTG-motif cell wall-anchored protein
VFITPAACAALVLAPTAAQAITTPAPPSEASGVAVQVGSLRDLSKTGATAGSGAPSAQASVVSLGGTPLLGLGGTRTGDGQTGGSLADAGDSLPARLEVAPWHAAADGSTSRTHHARSSAAAARAELPTVVKAGVLASDSEASWTDRRSSGHAITDGVNIRLLDTANIVLLHSETTSEGRGHSYLVGLDGTEIGTDDQLGGSPLCALDAGSLLSLSCLTASGGTGADGLTSGAANIATVDTAIDAIAMADPVAAFSASTSSGSGAGSVEPAPVAAVEADESVRGDTSPASDAAGQALGQASGQLPHTGSNPASLLAGALGAILSGLGLRRFRPGTAGR